MAKYRIFSNCFPMVSANETFFLQFSFSICGESKDDGEGLKIEEVRRTRSSLKGCKILGFDNNEDDDDDGGDSPTALLMLMIDETFKLLNWPSLVLVSFGKQIGVCGGHL